MSVFFNGNKMDSVTFNGQALTELTFNGIAVLESFNPHWAAGGGTTTIADVEGVDFGYQTVNYNSIQAYFHKDGVDYHGALVDCFDKTSPNGFANVISQALHAGGHTIPSLAIEFSSTFGVRALEVGTGQDLRNPSAWIQFDPTNDVGFPGGIGGTTEYTTGPSESHGLKCASFNGNHTIKYESNEGIGASGIGELPFVTS